MYSIKNLATAVIKTATTNVLPLFSAFLAIFMHIFGYWHGRLITRIIWKH